MGATINAYTSRESTAYYARCIGRDIGGAMDILGDMVMNSKLDGNAIARERDVILREAKEVRLRRATCYDSTPAAARVPWRAPLRWLHEQHTILCARA